ncbi:MAG: hypothetical protein LW714_11520 [Oxalobacteraceae bacterium]|jgi:Ca2+-binding RTX toxin-like protein|nr:hypothetical protein [Oxalobacteraceae bacterium]
MATITLTNSPLESSLSTFTTPGSLINFSSSVSADLDSLLSVGAGFDSEPAVSGLTFTYKNPSYSGEIGDYNFKGTVTTKFNSNDELQSASGSLTGATIATSDGTITLKGSAKTQTSATKTAYSFSFSDLSFVGTNGSAWSFKGSIAESYSYDLKTDDEIYKSSVSITSFSSTDINKNKLTLSGSLKYSDTTELWTGYMTTLSLTVGTSKLAASGLKISYETLVSTTQLGTVADWSAQIFSGNDTITSTAGNNVVNGYAGNDKLVGGKGSDVFQFTTALDKTTNVDQIVNFKKAGTDTLQLKSSLFADYRGAQDFITDTTTMTDHACIIYNSAKGTLSYDADGTGSIEAVQFATLVGKVTFTADDITLI